MDKLGVKATFYDFFGYLLPGICLLLVIKISYINLFIDFNYENLFVLFEITDIYQFMMILVIAYILGHLISTTGYYLIEKAFIDNIKYLKNKFDIMNLLSNDLNKTFQNKFRSLFKSKYSKPDMRLLICEAEENKPSIYSTALVYLTFCGMARSLALVFLTAFIYEMVIIIITRSFPFYSFVYLVIGVISFLHYIRFKRYFAAQIINGFIVEGNKKDKNK